MTLDEFLVIYEADDDEWWRAASGDHQNWFEEAVDRWRAAEAEIEALRAALAAAQPQADELKRLRNCVKWAAEMLPCTEYERDLLRAAAGSATPTESDSEWADRVTKETVRRWAVAGSAAPTGDDDD